MGGLWNTPGHETEPESNLASALFLEAVSTIFNMLVSLERQDLHSAENLRLQCVADLRDSANMFRAIADHSSDYPLFTPGPSGHEIELAEAASRLRDFGYSVPMRNPDVAKIAVREIESLASVVEQSTFQNKHFDWYSIRDVIQASDRATALGVLIARISALHGNDPEMQN